MIQAMKSGAASLARRHTLGVHVPALFLAIAATSSAAQPSAPASRPDVRLRIVGGLGGLNQYTRHEARFWNEDLRRLSQGKYGATIVPFNQAGVPGQEMLNLMRLGVIPFGTALLSQVSNEYPELGAPDIAGLNPDMATLRRVIGAFRPYLERTLRERHGVELLAVYVYPAQVIFCRQPVKQLADLAGRRVRVSGNTQADFVRALGGVPVFTEFTEVVANIQSENTQCAITGAMSGNALGLHKVTQSLYTMPLSWGIAVFGANTDAWNALPPELQALLRRELPKLEAEVWRESERDTGHGIACNTGADACTSGSKGAMVEARPSSVDEKRRREIFAGSVLPKWLQRCGRTCVEVWEQTIGPVVGIKAPVGQ